uniref:Uncharacterized protein n=1 Tax=Arundo donax TaxID=35708 RepID=A0A0A9B4U0_ARUDO
MPLYQDIISKAGGEWRLHKQTAKVHQSLLVFKSCWHRMYFAKCQV